MSPVGIARHSGLASFIIVRQEPPDQVVFIARSFDNSDGRAEVATRMALSPRCVAGGNLNYT
jgi:hypothetical protein